VTHRSLSPTWRRLCAVLAFLTIAVSTGPALRAQQSPLRKIGELDLAIRGLTATTELSQTLPRQTASGVRISVRAGDVELTSAEAVRFLGDGFTVVGELSGPGLTQTLTLPLPPDLNTPVTGPADPLLLPIPPLSTAGIYTLSNLRILHAGRVVLDVAPRTVTLEVLDQILITSVKTRQLTLDEIKAKGIVLDSDDYLGFEFTIAMKLESTPVTISFPAVFDRQGIPIPSPLEPPSVGRTGLPMPTLLPVLLEPIEDGEEGPDNGEKIALTLPSGAPVTIPSLIVIPGNVGYLKQFFSAQLFVANGAPVGTSLVVRNITGTVALPKGDDHESGTTDDPLTLAQTETGVHATLPVRGAGGDGAPGTSDDQDALAPGEQGQAEFLIRGEKEGFHTIDFDVRATLEGLPVGPVQVKGKASGGVLVRNQYYDMTFTAPAIVRAGEEFKLFATVTNIGQAIGNDISVTLDASRMSGMHLVGEATQSIRTLYPGDAQSLEFRFEADVTGQVVASYLKFETDDDAVTGQLNFTASIGERGVPLSPDTLVLPAVVDAVPGDVVKQAMRVLGQAWSAVNAPPGTLPSGVVRPAKDVVFQKALSLAEAGLRITLGQSTTEALRDFGFDFYAGTQRSSGSGSGSGSGTAAPRLDVGFDQILRETKAGDALARALGSALQPAVASQGGALAFERAMSEIAASGPDFIALTVDSGSSVDVALTDATGRRTAAITSDERPERAVPGAILMPLGPVNNSPTLGLITAPSGSPYTLALTGRAAGTASFSITVPNGTGAFVRGTATGIAVSPSWRGRVVIDLAQPDQMRLVQDTNGDGADDSTTPLFNDSVLPQGAKLLSAHIIGPETIDSAGPFGVHTVLLFDRVVAPASAAAVSSYSVPSNSVRSAKAVMSQRLVLATLTQPEGPYVPTTMSVTGVTDGRGVLVAGGNAPVPLESRLIDPGAVVSGRVMNADGSPVASGFVVYDTNPDYATCQPEKMLGVSSIDLDAEGKFQFRYVRRDNCGFPFGITAVDRTTGAPTGVSRYVRTAGEQIVIDFALFGRGSVTGVVRDLNGNPVANADVAVASTSDPQFGARTATNVEGQYTVHNLPVGGVTVNAARHTSAGHAAGRIDRAGTTATVNVTLDGGTVKAAGRVMTRRGLVVSPLAGQPVVYRLTQSNAVVGVAHTDTNGRYSMTGLPTGTFTISATFENHSAMVSGIAAAGDDLKDRDLVIELPETGTITGTVYTAGGQRAADVFVTSGGHGLLTGPDGTFRLENVPVGADQAIMARTRDGLRTGSVGVRLTQADQTIDTTITLSGLGSVVVTVKGVDGNVMSGVQVRKLGCNDPCGCFAQTTNGQGQATFTNVPVGGFSARAFQLAPGFTDVVNVNASVRRDGETATVTVQFKGAGVLSGTVKDPDGAGVFGADIVVRSMHFVNDGMFTCGLEPGESHRVRTDTNGKFRLSSINVGDVSVTASHFIYATHVGAEGAITHAGDEEAFELTLVDTTAGELSGTVHLPDGVTSAGAGVEVTMNGMLPDVTVRTNAEGHYAFAKIFPEGRYTLTARDPASGGVIQRPMYLRAGQNVEQDLTLKGRGTVRVTVADADGVAAGQAYVRVTELEFPNRVHERAVEPPHQGVIEIERVFQGPISVEASDAFGRGGRSSGEIPAPDATVDVKVTLSVTGTVNGHFVLPDAEETPIRSGVVKLFADNRAIGQITTQDDGFFEFTYVPAGAFRLEAIDPRTARTGGFTGTITTNGQIVEAKIVAQPLGTVTGTVFQGPTPQPGALVEVRSGTYHINTIADANGLYVVEGVPVGAIEVSASLDSGFLRGSASSFLTGNGLTLNLNVSLRASGIVTGQVMAAGTQPVPLTLVTIRVGGVGGGSQSITTQADGSFRFERVPAGTATLNADALGSIDRGRAVAEVPAGGSVNVQVPLNGVGVLTGRALDSQGVPVSGTIRFTGSGAFPYQQSVAVGPDGVYTLPAVLAGPVKLDLDVRTGPFVLTGTASGTVEADVIKTLDVQAQASGRVIGRVYQPDGTSEAAGVQVTVDLGNGRKVVVTTGTDGRFALSGIPIGSFVLRVKDPAAESYAFKAGLAITANGQEIDVEDLVLDNSVVTLVTIDPPDGAIDVPLQQQVVLTFSDPLINASGISVRHGATTLGVQATPSADGRSVTLRPYSSWPNTADLDVVVSTSVTDIFGRHPLETVTRRFTTVDTNAPQVTSITPVNDDVQIPSNAVVTVTFNERLNASTNPSTLITVTGGPTGTVQGAAALANDNTVLTFTPNAPLAEDTTYVVVVNGATDRSGNQQTLVFSSTFSTIDHVVPVLTVLQPLPGAWVRTPRPVIQVGVADAVSGIAPALSTLLLDGGNFSEWASRTLNAITFQPAEDLLESASHQIAATATDRAGNTGSIASTFGVDLTPPTAAQVTGVVAGQVLQGTLMFGAVAEDATSGIAKIDILVDGVPRFPVTGPEYAVAVNTRQIPDGPHVLSARAIDVAGHVGPVGPSLNVTVDNNTLNVTISVPAAESRHRDSVTVTASVSEPVQRVEFSIAGGTPVVDTASPYTVTMPLAEAPEGRVFITATGATANGDLSSGTRAIVIDRTPPTAPDAAVINAEPPVQGYSLVYGRQGAVEPRATVEITNTATNARATAFALTDGSFSASIAGVPGQQLSLIAIDEVGNRSTPTTIEIRSTPSLPPVTGSTSLTFEGVLPGVDRVGAGTAQLSADGLDDAVFTVGVAIGAGVTRQLQYIDLVGPSITRSTRSPGSMLGVASDPGGNLLNGPNGQVAFPITGGTTLTLFASNAGFIVPGGIYRVTVQFTDGSRFIADCVFVAPEDRPRVARSLLIAAAPSALWVTAAQPGTSTLTLTDIRDIDGALVPDGARVAITAVDMGSNDPRGRQIRSAGGAIADGEPAANKANFRVFTVFNGQVTATYQSAPVTPGNILGASAVVQVMPADENGNVLGTEAIGTFNLELRAATDRALVMVQAGSLYADRGDNRTAVRIVVRDAAGQLVPDGTRFGVTSNHCRADDQSGSCITSFGGTLIGGASSPDPDYRIITIQNGEAALEYSSVGLAVTVGNLENGRISVVPLGADDRPVTNKRAIGTGRVALVSAGSVELTATPDNLPMVSFSGTSQITVRHVRDGLANRVPQGASFLLSAGHCKADDQFGSCIVSAGGAIVDGEPIGTDYRRFVLEQGAIGATYSTDGVTGLVGQTKIANLTALMADPAGAYISKRTLAVLPLRLLAPSHAVGSATPSSILADARLHTSVVTFTTIVDADGNPLPDGSKVAVSAGHCVGDDSFGSCIVSANGQILNGDPVPGDARFRAFTVQNGGVSVTYGDQGLTVRPGQQATANVVLLEADSTGLPTHKRALGVVPVTLTGLSSATASASPNVLLADGSDRRVTVTVTDLKDSLGKPVPDGTAVAISAAHCVLDLPSGSCIVSAGGTIIGGGPVVNEPLMRLFVTQNGQVTFEYSSEPVAVSSGERTAVIQIASATPDGVVISDRVVATTNIALRAASTAVVAATPPSLTASGLPQLSQIVVSGLTDSGGAPLPDGAKVALTTAHCAADNQSGGCISSVAGGQLSPAGTTAGDGTPATDDARFQIYSVAGGEVRAAYSSASIATQSTLTARVAVVPASASGATLTKRAIGVGVITLQGVTSAQASGPSSLSLAGGGSTAAVTFSGIRDTAGNIVPDGTVVAVTAKNCALAPSSGNGCLASASGTIVGGTPNGSFNMFTVMNGSVTVTYSTAGASTGTARVQIAPARPDNTLIGDRALSGGVWAITITQ
jgi:hypothetical protein